MKPDRIIAYYRVSTDEQGRSGLGLEAQQAAVEAYGQQLGARIVGAYTKVETGKRDELDNRPELLKALAHVKYLKAQLVIAKFDRLTRSVYTTALLHRAGVDFVCCDNPGANKMTIQILAVVAENEARMISDRTKAALAAYKAGKRVSKRIRAMYPDGVPAEVVEARGGKLGAALPENRNLTHEARVKGARAAGEVARREADERARWLAPRLREWRAAGMTLARIAARLNAEAIPTARGRRWTHVQVSDVLGRRLDGDESGAAGSLFDSGQRIS
jgi:DNA invertase Pin-like site-specific DNA recombinase